MNRTAALRSLVTAHDVVGATGRVALGAAAVALLLGGLSLLAGPTVPGGLVLFLQVVGGLTAALAAAAGMLWIAAVLERRAAGVELAAEVDVFLASLPPASRR